MGKGDAAFPITDVGLSTNVWLNVQMLKPGPLNWSCTTLHAQATAPPLTQYKSSPTALLKHGKLLQYDAAGRKKAASGKEHGAIIEQNKIKSPLQGDIPLQGFRCIFIFTNVGF